jgi:hypothetical protein
MARRRRKVSGKKRNTELHPWPGRIKVGTRIYGLEFVYKTKSEAQKRAQWWKRQKPKRTYYRIVSAKKSRPSFPGSRRLRGKYALYKWRKGMWKR